MGYQEGTGVGCLVDRDDGTFDYRYFEPISSSQRHIQTIREPDGGSFRTGYGTVPHQGHADPLLGGGTSSTNFSRTQREIAHQTGPPKFCSYSGTVREDSLIRGRVNTTAQGREFSTVY